MRCLARLVAAILCMTIGNVCVADPAPRWAIDPAQAGRTLPPAGRSLFDEIATSEASGQRVYDIPFPFDALVRRIAQRAGCESDARCTSAVLIPLGRSLQRTAATPEFFAYPRAVVAVTGEGPGLYLKDRLYLGYQEKAALIEVISYNDAAGRFEFQLVKDYRAGGTPRVVYANRDVCIACHQNHAPIFSRQVWEETNANPRVAAMLESVRKAFYGIPVRRGVDIPNAIDDATDRANLLSVTQALWRDGCGADARCRTAALIAALQYRLSGERGFAADAASVRDDLMAKLVANVRARWPGGVAIPNPDLPNRDPLAYGDDAAGLAQSHVAARFEPLAPRQALEVWSADDAALMRRFVTGVTRFFSQADVRAIDERIASNKAAPTRTYALQCERQPVRDAVRFHCRGERASLSGRIEGTSGRIDALALDGREPLLDLAAANVRGSGDAWTFAVRSEGLQARTQDGSAIQRVELRANAATITVADDFAAFVARMKEPSPTLSRAALLDALGMPAQQPDWARYPAAAQDRDADDDAALPVIAQVFRQHCAACHRTHERFPPNFLHGDDKRVTAALSACAPRIYARLAMWERGAEAREKTPMPPPLASRDGAPAEVAIEASALSALRATVAELMRTQSGQVPRVDELLARGYENLQPCLPAGL